MRRPQLSALSDVQGEAVPGAPEEPVLEINDIQGNSLAGFNKDHQTLLCLEIGDVAGTKNWLRNLIPFISTLDEVLAFNRLFRAMRARRAIEPTGLVATWINIAFSSRATAKLAPTQAAELIDSSFQSDLYQQSGILGDPTDPNSPGHNTRWKVGGPGNVADILLMVASDSADQLGTEVDRLKTESTKAGLRLLYEEKGAVLPGAFSGHEHFGFKDGISQPGIRGRVSAGLEDFLTPRFFDPSDSRARLYARPGQPLIWPGQFILGLPRQDDQDPLKPRDPDPAYPDWARNGSYVVFRRLAQNVSAFQEFVTKSAKELNLSADLFGALLVGRWPSGAPVMRSPIQVDSELAMDSLANNQFLFESDTAPSKLRSVRGYPGDHFPDAKADFFGVTCPHIAHIRKVNPRDAGTDLGGANDTLTRLLLRRGLPYGPALVNVETPAPELVNEDRGLLFISYQASIVNQFETVVTRWANSTLQPSDGGHDPLIGQTENQGNRDRFIQVPRAVPPNTLMIMKEWILPTGGGYFFSPSIRAIKEVFAG
jgi:Dyp-type peroxidase family